MIRRAFGILLCVAGLSGCAVHEVHKDHDKIRTTLLDLYTNQIMDNLVRTANGMPIIQVDYTRLSGQVTIKNTLGGSDNQAATASNVFALPAATLSATRTIVTTLAGNLSNENTNQVMIEAVPVTTSNEVYDAYLEYLSLPGSLIVSHDTPPKGEAHLCKKYEGNYFWVPQSRRSDFFRLALLTTAQRGKGLLPPDKFFAVTLKEFISDEPNLLEPGNHKLRIKLDRKIPVDDGYLVLDGDAKNPQKFVIHPPDMPSTGPGPSEIVISTLDNEVALFKDLPKTAKIFLYHNQPALPTTDDLINRVNFQLQQIQFNQTRQQ